MGCGGLKIKNICCTVPKDSTKSKMNTEKNLKAVASEAQGEPCVPAGDKKIIMKQVESKAEFDEAINVDKLVIVDFYATWCGPCKVISPLLEDLAKQYPDVVFIKVDVDQSEEIVEEYRIQAMPTFILFRNGKKVGEVIGASIEKIKEQLLLHL